MGEQTKISWTHHTWNPWRGCTKVSPGCQHCYAESQAKRNPKILGVWGDKGTRVIASEAQWKEPLKWNRKAAQAGERRRVFCASMADVFEDRVELIEPLARLLCLIHRTPNLDWLLLTKRPQVIRRRLQLVKHIAPTTDPDINDGAELAQQWLYGSPMPNVWLGVSIEGQEQVGRLIYLAEIPAAVKFVSAEPLLGPLVLSGAHNGLVYSWLGSHSRAVQWVIVGGESGPNARPCDLAWIRSLVAQCRDAGVACFVKQVGRRPYIDHSPEPAASIARKHGVGPLVAEFLGLRDRKGGDMDEFPEDLRIRELPR